MFDLLARIFRKRRNRAEQGRVPANGVGPLGEHFDYVVAGVRDYAIFLLDVEGRVVSWNAGAERIKGYRAEEIIGEHFSRFYPPDAVAAGLPARELREASATGRFEDEGWRLRKDGSRFWANVVLTALRGPSGAPQGFLKITRDLTERKQAEESARRLLEEGAARRAAEASTLEARRAQHEEQRQREQLHVTLTSIGDAVIVTDAQSRITITNRVAQALTGWQENVIGRPLEEVFRIVNEQTREPVENPVAKVLRLGRVVGLANHTVLIAKDGTERPIDDSAAPILDAQGRVAGIVLVFRDITERRRAQEALRTTLEQLQIVTDSMAAPVTRCSRDFKYQWVSKPYAAWIGRPADGIIGRPIVDVIGKEAFDQLRPHFEQVLAGQVVRYEQQVHFQGLGPRWINAVYTPTLDRRGVPDGWVAVVIDVHERKSMEEAIRAGKEQLAAELEAMTRLHALSARLLTLDDLHTALSDVLEDAIVTSGADFGNIQLYNSGIGALEIVVQRGFRQDFLGHFQAVRVDEGSACAQAMQSGQRIVIEDVTLDPTYEPHRRVAAEAGYRAVQSTPLKNREGKVIGMLSTHFRAPHRPSARDERFLDLHARLAADLIERLRSDEALRDSEARKTAILKTALDAIVTIDAEGRVIEFNPAAEKMFGYGRVQAVGKPVAELIIPPSLRESHIRGLARYRTSGEGPVLNKRIELTAMRSDGTQFPVELSVRRISAGEPELFTASIRDITERKKSEDSLRFLAEASASLAGLVDYKSTLQKVASLAVPHFADWCTVDMLEQDGSLQRLAVAHVDPAKVEMAKELHRRHPPDPNAPGGVWHILRTGQSELTSEITDALLEQGIKDEELLRALRELGLKSYMGVPLRGREKTLGVLTFVAAESGQRYGPSDLRLAEDLAHRAAIAIENARLYSELKDADRRKDEFLAMLAHELRNPLAPIRNAVHIMKMPGVDGATIERARQMTERQVQHMVRLVDDLLDVSRIMTGRIELRKAPLDLGEVLANAVETAQPAIDASGQELIVAVPPEPLRLEGDPTRLAQVVANLLHNAAKFSPKAGRIRLTAEHDGREVVVRVRDEGAGIRSELLPHIFDLFVQADNSLERSQGGLGVGLTVVRKLVELHGGTVSAFSAGPGKGSEFTVRLPGLRETRDKAPRPGSPHPAPAAAARRILVVDDSVDAAESTAVLLRLWGHHVQLAHNGFEALQAAERFRPEAILLDIGLPGMNGYEVAKHLRQLPHFEKALLVAVTGYGQDQDRRRSEQAGIYHHLTKPVDLAKLQAVLQGMPASCEKHR